MFWMWVFAAQDRVLVFDGSVLRACSDGAIYTCTFQCFILRHEGIEMSRKKWAILFLF
jgi:hypothetical protein